MSTVLRCRFTLACLMTAGLILPSGLGRAEEDLPPGGAIFLTAATSFGSELIRRERSTPWTVEPLSPLVSIDANVREAHGLVYAIDSDADQIKVFRRNGVPVRTIDVGAGTRPRDIVFVSPELAFVSRANDKCLYRVNPQTGVGADSVDLSLFADDDGMPDMERMVLIGDRLFVQLRRIEDKPGPVQPNGALAVIDITTETIVDADLSTAELDAIELFGPAPRLPMYVHPRQEFLLVSATDGHHLSFSGGIELVDLTTLQSQGFVLTEIDLAAMGGFVVVDGENGYFLFHTDIVASNHLREFSVTKGAEFGPEIIVDIGTFLDSLLFDPRTDLLFMAISSGGLAVIDTTTNDISPDSPVVFDGLVIDQVLAAAIPGDVNGDGQVTLLDVAPFVNLLVNGQYQEEADINGDGQVNLQDVQPLVELLTQ